MIDTEHIGIIDQSLQYYVVTVFGAGQRLATSFSNGLYHVHLPGKQAFIFQFLQHPVHKGTQEIALTKLNYTNGFLPFTM